ncbi:MULTISPECIES: hypothetical protein [unclassified Okeania]|uniref:Uncharacterized protein n=1 Tax=Okeania hirsuta TaxID=1458930 RepID=A0A3N6RND9_9CYAN|nr:MULTISPECIES: hypothetical protein [unclassified Okeania]NET19619.1 hypothetical protein [Okeania sp. SIO1H5]NET96911.1 hypothetical protein [Okeania sp. SIO1H2]RQH25777.1 hypothetical protein D4Z78_02080 [Okeania hirsuta]RQH40844.1 hypothetical protein D5R40_15950 [Okeania hirsuta]
MGEGRRTESGVRSQELGVRGIIEEIVGRIVPEFFCPYLDQNPLLIEPLLPKTSHFLILKKALTFICKDF